MKIELTPVVSHLRVFGKGLSYAKRDEYDGILTVQWMDSQHVYLSGAHGTITHEIYRAAFGKLAEAGVIQVRYHQDRVLYEVDL